MEENPRAAKKGSPQLFCDRSKGGERRQQECRAENGERENGTRKRLTRPIRDMCASQTFITRPVASDV